MELLEKIHLNQNNISVLNFFKDRNYGFGTIIHVSENQGYKHEGLEDFLDMNVPEEIKFLGGSLGLMINPQTGEILAFQFSRSDVAIKIVNSKKYANNCAHIRQGLLRNLKIKAASKVSLRYFSNIWGDEDTVVDLRMLDNNWVYGLYILNELEKEVNNYYQTNKG